MGAPLHGDDAGRSLERHDEHECRESPSGGEQSETEEVHESLRLLIAPAGDEAIVP